MADKNFTKNQKNMTIYYYIIKITIIFATDIFFNILLNSKNYVRISHFAFRISKSVLGLLFLCVLFSCTKEENKEQPLSIANEKVSSLITTNTSAPVSIDELEDLKYNTYVKSTAVGLLNLALDKKFQKVVNSEVAKKFDGDDNALLKDVFASFAGGQELSDKLNESYVDNWDYLKPHELLVDALYKTVPVLEDGKVIENTVKTGFKYYDETKYLQMYIPSVEQVDLDETPIVAIAVDDDCLTNGYKYDVTVQEWRPITVDEEMSKKHLIWVISVNESVGNDGKIPPATPSFSPTSANSVITKNPNQLRTVQIDEVFISNKKECWLCGKAEIRMLGGIIAYENCFSDYRVFNSNNNIVKIGNDDLQKWKTGNFTICPDTYIADNYRPYGKNEMAWVLYEFDDKKKYQKSTKLLPCDRESYTYRSKQVPYMIENLFNPISSYNDCNKHIEGPYLANDGESATEQGLKFKCYRVCR